MCIQLTRNYAGQNLNVSHDNSTLLQGKENKNAIKRHIIAGQTKQECNKTTHYCRANPTGEGSIELSSASLGSDNNEEGGR